MNNLLFIGTLPPPEGGITMQVEILLKNILKHRVFDIEVINICLLYKGFKFFPYALRILKKLLILVRSSQIITFQVSSNTFKILGPVVYLLSRIFNKPLVVRRFAGNGIELYELYSSLTRAIINHTIFKAELTYYETKYQTEYFKKISLNPVKYMPNHKELIKRKPSQSIIAEKFIFVGRICSEKGINQIINVFKKLPLNITIDLYGNDVMDIETNIAEVANINYRGEFDNNDIYTILSNYDALVLPTYWRGEGQPGVIVESLISGVPVISSKLPGIQEIVVQNKTGILITPKSENELESAIKKLNEESKFFLNLKQNIINDLEKFDAQYWYRVFEQDVLSLLSNERKHFKKI